MCVYIHIHIYIYIYIYYTYIEGEREREREREIPCPFSRRPLDPTRPEARQPATSGLGVAMPMLGSPKDQIRLFG